MKKIAVINDISGFGKCSLTAAIPVINAHKIQCCPLPTGVFSNQTGYESFKSADLTEYMKDFAAEWKKLGARFDGILTGFIPNSRQGGIIIDFINDFKDENTFVAVDPIMGDDGEVYPCYDKSSITAVKAVAAKADLITPNVTELALLCEKDCRADYSLDEIEEMAKSLPNKYVVTTGIEIGEGELANAVCSPEGFDIVKCRKIGNHFSGTGDVFSAFVLSEIVNGSSVLPAVEKATAFIEKAILNTGFDKNDNYNPNGIDFEQFISFV